MSKPIISGIQQIGIGVSNVHEGFAWYRKHFGMDVPMFDEAAEAALMLPYTGGQPRSRHAILAVNLQGGGGFEIWQYTSRTPEPASFDIKMGDYGIYITKIKSKDVKATYEQFKKDGVLLLGEVSKDPNGNDHFYLKDPFGNLFEIVKGDTWFSNNGNLTGGPAGAVIGVSDIEKARTLYSDILGYDEVVYDHHDTFKDLKALDGGDHKCRRVLLKHSQPRKGAFSNLFGNSTIELIQVEGRTPRKIYEGRLWGDLGFIHLCFDINGMAQLKAKCEAAGYPFTVDSADSFDMGEAAGHFTYIEDPDGTLIEFVETHKIPMIKAIGWYLDLRKRNPEKALPNWMLKTLRFSRVKD